VHCMFLSEMCKLMAECKPTNSNTATGLLPVGRGCSVALTSGLPFRRCRIAVVLCGADVMIPSTGLALSGFAIPDTYSLCPRIVPSAAGHQRLYCHRDNKERVLEYFLFLQTIV